MVPLIFSTIFDFLLQDLYLIHCAITKKAWSHFVFLISDLLIVMNYQKKAVEQHENKN